MDNCLVHISRSVLDPMVIYITFFQLPLTEREHFTVGVTN